MAASRSKSAAGNGKSAAASAHIGSSSHVGPIGEAVADGLIPGGFTEHEGTTCFAFPELLYRDTRGSVRSWRILICAADQNANRADLDPEFFEPPDDTPALVFVVSRVVRKADGKVGKEREVVPTFVAAGKNLGKKNATTPTGQAVRDALGLYNKKLRSHDIVSPEEAEAAAEGPPPSRARGEAASRRGGPASDRMPPPMLVQDQGKTSAAVLTKRDFADGVVIQYKLNGTRAVVVPRALEAGFADDEVGDTGAVAYSRTRKIYSADVNADILAEVAAMHEAALEAGVAWPGPGECNLRLDGEIYAHGKSLIQISGQTRRKTAKGDSIERVFNVFDAFCAEAGETPSRDRREYLDAWFAAADEAGVAHPHVARVENFPARSDADIAKLMKQALRLGYEGVIARKESAGYEYGYSNYHSPNLVKVKPVFTAEFPVVGYTEGSRGKEVGAIIWRCAVPPPGDPARDAIPGIKPDTPYDEDDCEFDVVPKSISYPDRKRLFACMGKKEGKGARVQTRFSKYFAGQPLTVEYREISSKTGKPLQAKAEAFRTYEGGDDPVARALQRCLEETD